MNEGLMKNSCAVCAGTNEDGWDEMERAETYFLTELGTQNIYILISIVF